MGEISTIQSAKDNFSYEEQKQMNENDLYQNNFDMFSHSNKSVNNSDSESLNLNKEKSIKKFLLFSDHPPNI